MRRVLQFIFIMAMTAFVPPAVAQDKPSDYQLGAGDLIRILVFRNPDLTLETRVSEGGSISYPLIGSVVVGGSTISAAEARIAKALKDGRFLEQPQVNVILLQVRGNQVAVLGQVGKPGRIPLESKNIHLSDILSEVGGIAPGGADVAILTGKRDGKPIRQEIDIPGIFLDKHGQSDVRMAAGDIVYVHRAPTYYVHGEVQRPGSYRVERGMFVMQALAQAGGLTVRGSPRRLRLYRRNGAGVLETLSPEMTTEVLPNDVIYVHESFF